MPLGVIFYVALALSIGLSIYNMIAAALYTPPEPPVPSPKELTNVPTAEQGKSIPVLFGTRWVTQPNVVWWGDPKSRKNRVDSSALQ